MNQPAPPPARSPVSRAPQQTDLVQQAVHYSRLLWRWKWFVAIVWPAIATAVFFLVLKFVSLRPDLPVTVLIGLEKPALVGSIEEHVNMGSSKVELLRTNRFLREVVEKLSLRLIIEDLSRKGVVDSCTVDDEAMVGQYSFVIEGDSYRVLFTNRKERITERVVLSGTVSSLSGLRLQGIRLRFTHEFRKNPRSFGFHIQSSHYAAEQLLRKLTIVGPDPRRGIDHITITLEGRDYEHIAEVINTIADTYVEQNLSFRKRRIRETLALLERQLATAGSQFQTSEQRLRSFLSSNPSVGLNVGAQQTLGAVMDRERQASEMNEALGDARRLQSNFAGAGTPEGKIQITSEILHFLVGKNNTRAAVLTTDFQKLLSEKSELERTVSKEHPSVAENLRRLDAAANQAILELNGFAARTDQGVRNLESETQGMKAQLHSLPNKERQLAELSGRQQVDQELHAQIVRRYNEAKVADVAEVADVFIMDYAVPPIPQSPFLMLLKLLGAALLAGGAAAIGPALVVDFFDKTARTEYKLARLTAFPLLEIIPVIPDGLGNTQMPRKQGTLPVTARHVAHYIDEQFRSLRTKTLMRLHGAPDRSIAVTSLNMGEGKSTIATNLAVTMAQQGLKTLLIDADLRRGRVADLLGVKRTPGLSTILTGADGGEGGAIRATVQATLVPRLYCLSAGEEIDNPQELLGSPLISRLKNALSREFEVLIVDTPPLGAVSDGVAIHELVSRYILVVRAGRTNVDRVQKILSEYPPVMQKVMGVVLNRADKGDIVRRKAYSKYYRRERDEGDTSPA